MPTTTPEAREHQRLKSAARYRAKREEILAKQRAYAQRPVVKERCRLWNLVYQAKPERRAYQAEWRAKNRTVSRAYVKAYADKLRNDLLTLMGGKCVRCGFDDRRALQVDHVFGKGTHDRKVNQNSSRRAYNKKVEEFKRGELQLLCANCNWIKRAENDETRKKVAG